MAAIIGAVGAIAFGIFWFLRRKQRVGERDYPER